MCAHSFGYSTIPSQHELTHSATQGLKLHCARHLDISKSKTRSRIDKVLASRISTQNKQQQWITLLVKLPVTIIWPQNLINTFFPVGGFKVGLDLLVEFEFRTTRPTGVLLGISSQKMDGMGIEMIDEKVSVCSPNTISWHWCFHSALFSGLATVFIARKLDSTLSFFQVVTIHVHFYHHHPVQQPVL